MLTGSTSQVNPLPAGRNPITRGRSDATPRHGTGVGEADSGRAQPLHIDPFTKRIVLDIVLLPGFELHDLSCLADVTALCNETVGKTLFTRRLVGLTDEAVLSCTGFAVTPDLAINDAGSLHNVAVLAGPTVTDPNRVRLRLALWRFAHGGTRYIAVGHGCGPLLRCGLVHDPHVAVALELRDTLGEIHPDARCVDRPFHVDRRLLSCAGGDGIILLALHCIARICGDAVAIAIADRINFDHFDTRFSGPPGFVSPSLRSVPPILRDAIGIMSTHVEEPLTTSELAKRVGYSSREIQRRFIRHYGIPPSRFYKNYRLDRAQRLLRQTCMSVTEVSLAAGFKTVSHFSELYVRRFGNRPSEERRSAQPQ
jgi:transcriptional regulator GlxA family with amidase domain